MRKTLGGVPVSEAFVARLTGRKGLTRAQIRTAVRFAKLASTPGAETYGAGMGAILSGGHTALTESLIDRQLKNADQALGNKADASRRCSVISYDLSMRHVESRLTLPPSSARQAFLLSSYCGRISVPAGGRAPRQARGARNQGHGLLTLTTPTCY